MTKMTEQESKYLTGLSTVVGETLHMVRETFDWTYSCLGYDDLGAAAGDYEKLLSILEEAEAELALLLWRTRA